MGGGGRPTTDCHLAPCADRARGSWSSPTTGETWVRTLGGRVGDIGQKVEGEAVLPQGKRMVLFLLARPDGRSVVAGMSQGVWMVVRGTDGLERIQPQVSRGCW